MQDPDDAPEFTLADNRTGRKLRNPAQPLSDFLRLPWMGHALLILALVFCMYNSSLWWHADAMDDAYITFRHSKNLVDGHGPVYNPGERVEGYTTPSWMLLMAGVIAVGGDPVLWSKIIGMFCALGLIYALYRGLLRVGVLPGGAGLAAMTLACCPTLNAYATSGMETCLYALLFFLALERLVRRDRSYRNMFLCSLLFILSALTHPEALALWTMAGLYIFITHIRSEWKTVACFALPGLLSVAHFAWRFWYYGDLLPNTYYAWTGAGFAAIPDGLWYLERFLRNPSFALWMALACYAAKRTFSRHSSAVIVMGGAVAFHVLYLVKIGGDHMSAFRACLVFLGPMAYLAGLLFSDNDPRQDLSTRNRIVGTAAAVLVILISLCHTQPHYLKPYRTFLSYYDGNSKLGRYLAEEADAETVIAVMAAGAIPYYAGLRSIDMLGLNEPYIARLPFPDIKKAGLHKWDLPYVLSKQPTIIVVNRGYFRAGDVEGHRAAGNVTSMIRHAVELDIFETMKANRDYQYRPIHFPDGSRFYVFRRRNNAQDR